ncbi:MAG UNVERIFIED_CONTAM: hypothetical protein LVT10_20915 [Anaerolineae bacterium]
MEAPSDKSYAVVGVGIEQGSGSYTIDFLVQRVNPQPAVEFSIPIQVAKGDFLQQSVTLVDPKIASLIDRTIEDNEYVLLDELTQATTQVRYWEGSGFGAPTTAELSCTLWGSTLLQRAYETRHTGWDYNGGLGDTMNASASGRVGVCRESCNSWELRPDRSWLWHLFGLCSPVHHQCGSRAIHPTRASDRLSR